MALEPLFLDLIRVYRDAYQALLKRLTEQEIRGLSTYHTKALIEDVERITQQLLQYHSDWINYAIPMGYQEGSNSAVEKLTKAYHMTDIDISFGGVHQEAVNAIIRDTFQNVAAATTYMEDSLRETLRDAAKEKFRIDMITGETRRLTTKGFMTSLNQKGFTVYYDEKGRYIPLREYANAILDNSWVGFVDAAGRKWDLLNYCEMLTRTKYLEATNQGTENRLVQNGLDLVLISSHGAEDWCRFYENRVFSITGQSSEYPPLSQVPNGGCPMHPRCKHSETPFIEKFESKELIEYGKSLDDKFLGLNNEKGHADQAALRKLEKEYPIRRNRNLGKPSMAKAKAGLSMSGQKLSGNDILVLQVRKSQELMVVGAKVNTADGVGEITGFSPSKKVMYIKLENGKVIKANQSFSKGFGVNVYRYNDKIVKLPELPKLEDTTFKAAQTKGAQVLKTSPAETTSVKPPKPVKLTERDIDNIQYYTSSAFNWINSSLRGEPEVSSEMMKNAKEISKQINKALAKLPSYQGTTYRVVDFAVEFPSEKAKLDEFLKNHTAGSKVFYKAFTSTSTDRNIWGGENKTTKRVQRVIMEVKGKNGKDIMKYSANKAEKEVLFKAGSEFMVKSVRVNEFKDIVIELEEI